MELQEALRQIDSIRAQIARTEAFRGYRALTVAGSALLATGAAMVQASCVPAPAAEPWAYLGVWLGAALGSIAMVASELVRDVRHADSPLVLQKTRAAVARFLPSLAAGALVTVAVAGLAPERLGVLPGLWQLLFGLGVLASLPLLPRAIVFPGSLFLASGTALLVLPADVTLSPWCMGIPFAIGQLWTALVLHGARRERSA